MYELVMVASGSMGDNSNQHEITVLTKKKDCGVEVQTIVSVAPIAVELQKATGRFESDRHWIVFVEYSVNVGQRVSLILDARNFSDVRYT
jgi:hypothetical protein